MFLLPSSDRQLDVGAAPAALVKTSGLPAAVQSKTTTKSLAVQQRGVPSKLIRPGRGLFESLANCWPMCKHTHTVSAHNPLCPNHPPPPPPPPPEAWKETSGQTNTLNISVFCSKIWATTSAATMKWSRAETISRLIDESIKRKSICNNFDMGLIV